MVTDSLVRPYLMKDHHSFEAAITCHPYLHLSLSLSPAISPSSSCTANLSCSLSPSIPFFPFLILSLSRLIAFPLLSNILPLTTFIHLPLPFVISLPSNYPHYLHLFSLSIHFSLSLSLSLYPYLFLQSLSAYPSLSLPFPFLLLILFLFIFPPSHLTVKLPDNPSVGCI
jgi:hypothetical protein